MKMFTRPRSPPHIHVVTEEETSTLALARYSGHYSGRGPFKRLLVGAGFIPAQRGRKARAYQAADESRGGNWLPRPVRRERVGERAIRVDTIDGVRVMPPLGLPRSNRGGNGHPRPVLRERAIRTDAIEGCEMGWICS